MKDLVRPWGIAAFVWILGSIVITMVTSLFASLDQLTTQLGKGLWAGAPSLLLYIGIAIAGALTHRAPYRARPGRHAAAALAIPCLGIVAMLALSLLAGTVGIAIIGRLAGQVIGTVLGWQVADRIRGTKTEARVVGGAYF